MEPDGVGTRDGKYVQSLERALNILEVMAEISEPVTVTELANKVNLKTSTAHRLLTTLLYRGYVEQDKGSTRYRLGLKILEIANAVTSFSDIRSVARPYLEELVARCNETSNLTVLDENEIVYIDQIESHNYIIVKMFAQVGNRGPVHCTASGKALLAYLPEEKLDQVLSVIDYKQYTSETITDPELLKKELIRVRKDQYAVDWGEMEENVRCIAAPIFDYAGKAVASIGVSGPSSRITHHYMNNELSEIVKEVAEKASARLGYSN
ncbi:MAG: IclR family transcriptional regulator [Bacillota bacterium]